MERFVKKRENKNASQRRTYVGEIFNKGADIVEKSVLEDLSSKGLSDFHKKGYMHIHDLDAYGLTYNCLAFNLLNEFPYNEFLNLSDSRKIIKLFEHYKGLISKIGNEQSGGMAFANFDNDTAEILTTLEISDNDCNREQVQDQISSFICWCNDSHERLGEVSYYVTLNLGLAKCELSRFICEIVITEFENLPASIIKPNIVFKVKKGINIDKDDPNRFLLEKAMKCSGKKMIPTYLLCDCELNREVDPKELSIMGCRTRVVDNMFGEDTSIGRGNICNATINLVRLALESNKNYDVFKEKWLEVAKAAGDILIYRYEKLLKEAKKESFPTNQQRNLWCISFSDNTLEDIFKQGTLSVGFIGLSEAMEVLTGEKFYENNDTYEKAKDFMEFMRKYIDDLRDQKQLNFSLLAPSGEYISGRFPKLDKQSKYRHEVMEKEFYTNSFHINVDSKISAFEKVQKEGAFHKFCNGGCITYVEFNSPPIDNSQAIEDIMKVAEKSGVHYLGYNFPLDICNECTKTGVFDTCSHCGSSNITRIRRVSGYLEVLDFFTDGKVAEVDMREENNK